MTLLALISIIFFAFAVYNLSTAFADIPTSRTSKMMMLAKKHPREKVKEVLGAILSGFAVEDFTVTDIPLEESIARFYQKEVVMP